MMSLMHKLTNRLSALNPFWIFVIRLSLGIVFIQTGWGKLNHLSDVTLFFQSLGIPFPHYQAAFASAVEFIGGIALIFGFFTRLFSLLLCGVMAVAILTAQLPELHSFLELFGILEWAYLILFGFLVINGAGKYSLDHILCKRDRSDIDSNSI